MEGFDKEGRNRGLDVGQGNTEHPGDISNAEERLWRGECTSGAEK